jgi:hypothetical protein
VIGCGIGFGTGQQEARHNGLRRAEAIAALAI